MHYGSRVVATLAARGRETSLIDLRLVRLAEDTSEAMGDDGEMCAVVLVGTVDVRVGGMDWVSPSAAEMCSIRRRTPCTYLRDRCWSSGRSRIPSSRLPSPLSWVEWRVVPA